MAAFGAGDQVASAPPVGGAAGFGTWNLPNFVGELFKLSPLETPFLSMIGGLTGGQAANAPVFTWQDTLHRAPALQSNPEGDDASFDAQKRNERRNVAAIHQYGVELSYTKQAATGMLGSGGATPVTGATSILGVQPVQDEMSEQLQTKIEQCALDVELMFLTGTFAWPNDGAARQTQGIIGAVDAAVTTDWTGSNQPAGRTVIQDISQKMYDNGAKFRNCVIFVNSQEKQDIGDDYQFNTTGGWNIAPRSYSVFGVDVTDIETNFAKFPIVLNRHLPADTLLVVDLAVCAPRFLPIRNRGHFFLEPLAKSGAYDRMQLYGEIGLRYGPGGWHGHADNLNTV